MLENISTTQDEIVAALQNEPAQLQSNKSSFFDWIKWMITLPIKIITWPLRTLFMVIIAPVSYDIVLNDEQKYQEFLNNGITTLKGTVFKIKKIDYTTSSNDKCSATLAFNESQKTPIADRKLVINFGGNAEVMVGRFYALQYIDKPINSDIIFVEYPKSAKSSKELVDAGVSAILRAINAGYKFENITIAGHSLGGAVSAIALQEVKQYLNAEEERFASYINHKSFTKLGDVVATPDGFMSKVINGIAWALGVQLDAAQAIKSGLPVKEIAAYYGKYDTLIGEASVAHALEKNDSLYKGQPAIKISVGAQYADHNSLGSPRLYGIEGDEEADISVIQARTFVDHIAQQKEEEVLLIAGI